jgi:hypothetical protein
MTHRDEAGPELLPFVAGEGGEPEYTIRQNFAIGGVPHSITVTVWDDRADIEVINLVDGRTCSPLHLDSCEPQTQPVLTVLA